MSKIDLKKLTNVAQKDGKTVARCPACAARGGDATGNNLVVFPDGKFGCAAFPKDKEHNALILHVAGSKDADASSYSVPIKWVNHAPPQVIKVVGRFGHHSATAPSANTTAARATALATTDPEAVPKPRPARPPDIQGDAAAGGATPPTETKPPRRPSSLDDFLASKGMTWKTSSDDKVPMSFPKKRQRANTKTGEA